MEANPKPDVPPEHAEAYSEMCQQFMVGVLSHYQDATKIAIMRDLPATLQMNAVLVGSIVGALVPMMLISSASSDRAITEALRQQLPLIVAEARKRANQVKRGEYIG